MGMSAPLMGITSETPNSSDKPMNTGNGVLEAGVKITMLAQASAPMKTRRFSSRARCAAPCRASVSIATSALNPMNFRTVSGVPATRRSHGAISFRTAIFI